MTMGEVVGGGIILVMELTEAERVTILLVSIGIVVEATAVEKVIFIETGAGAESGGVTVDVELAVLIEVVFQNTMARHGAGDLRRAETVL